MAPPQATGAFDPRGAAYPPNPAAAQLPYVPGTQPAYSPGPQPAYGLGPQAPYVPGPQPGYSPGPQPGYSPGPQPGYSPGPQPGYSPGPQPAYPADAYAQQAGALAPVAPQGLAPYGVPLAGTLPSRRSTGMSGPTHRNALMTWLLPVLVMVVGGTVASILSFVVPMLHLLAPIAQLAGGIWFLVLAIRMIGEVRSVTHNNGFAWWPTLVPIYQWYWAWILVPQEVAKAKQLLGLTKPPQNIVLYIFLWHFALATDLNEMAGPR